MHTIGMVLTVWLSLALSLSLSKQEIEILINVWMDGVGVAFGQPGKTNPDDYQGFYVTGSALMAVGSLMDHSCAPSVRIERSINHRIGLVAQRDIAVGDALTIDYVDVATEIARNEPIQDTIKRFKARRSVISARYNFQCGCELCMSELSLITAAFERAAIGEELVADIQ
jgi:hypothetical protein